MFYDSNQIDNELLCKHCKERLKKPKLLPCGETICSSCEKKIKVDNKIYECLICKKNHEMPKNGLPNIKSLLRILSIMPTNVSSEKLNDSLEKLLDEINNKINFIKHGIENSNDLIQVHCIDLRNDVQLKAEQVIRQVNDISAKLIEEIDEYEKELIDLNRSKSESLDAFNAIAKELESFHGINSEYLAENELDYNLINKANEEAKNLINKAELEIQNLKDKIFNGKLFKFEKNNEEIRPLSSILGRVKIENILNIKTNQIQDIMALCEFPTGQKWNLIYRASQNGFEAADFHSKCDNKPNTLVVIKSENGNIFGGYTEKSWCSNYWYNVDENGFIFSLINKTKIPLKIKFLEKKTAIYCSPDDGPRFGFGDDDPLGSNFTIYIAEKSNTNTDSYSYINNEFLNPKLNLEQSNTWLAGSNGFKVNEIEVYTKQ
jgi:vacuolar-type H+-ATPase subunit H